jgi:signal transduction histidine kinase
LSAKAWAALPGVVLLASLCVAPCAAVAKPDDVLVVYSQNRLLPANVEVDRVLNESAAGSPQGGVRFFSEFLDAPTFAGEAYEGRTATYLREKYATRPPRVLVAGGADALGMLLRRRDEMFPGVPIVHVGVDREFLQTRTLPTDVIGIPIDYDFAGTLELALRLHPNARGLVVVTGASSWDREREADFRAAIVKLRLTLPVEYLAGLSTAEVTARLRVLQRDMVVITPGYFRDGAEQTFVPRESVKVMAAASAAPVYVPYASQIGTGAVGGRMTSFAEMGRATRAIIDRALQGAPASSISVPSRLAAPAQLDWRQVRRWGISADRIPPDAIVHFREPAFWEAHRTETIIAIAVILVQAGLIAALMFERRLRQQAAAALAESEKRIQLAAHAARLSPFVWDLTRNGNSETTRPGERRGPAQEKPESLPEVLETLHPADRERFERGVRKAAGDRAELDIEYRVLQPDGEVQWLLARGQTAADDTRRVTGVKMDITARKAAELQAAADRAALTHMSRAATMGQLSAAIAHQLNQPLAAILGNAETARKILAREGASVEELREMLDDIIADDNRAAEVIRRLRALYKRGETESSAVDLNELVRDTLDLLRAELTMRHVTVNVELATSLPAVQGSRIQLQQVVLNLLLNAADAVTGLDPSRHVVVLRTALDGRQARVCVVDRGTGIAPADLKRVFEPFWTTKASGVGVGLAICNAIIAAHHGTLTAANNAEGGATLCFTLPVWAQG